LKPLFTIHYNQLVDVQEKQKKKENYDDSEGTSDEEDEEDHTPSVRLYLSLCFLLAKLF
jgi:hypothetical protein